jgi:hypothetical protein
MARSRNIKPGFFLNEDLVELPFSTRLLFIGLWTIADREGRLEDRPKKIKMAIFPADNVDVEMGLSELHRAGMILRYVVDNERYIFIPGFVKHQNPHVHEQASVIPAPDQHSTSTVVATPLTSSLIPDSPLPITDSPNKRSKKSKPATTIPGDFKITDSMRKWAKDNCPSLNIDYETKKFKERCAAKGTEYKDWAAGWRTQMLNAEEWSTEKPKSTGTPQTNDNGHEPKKNIMHPDYEMPPVRTSFPEAAETFWNMPDASMKRYEEMKTNWLKTAWAKGHEHEIDEYERSFKFRERQRKEGQAAD